MPLGCHSPTPPHSGPRASQVDVASIAAAMRSYYEGSEFDQTVGLAAGPWGTPDHAVAGSADGKVKGNWERTIGARRCDTASKPALRPALARRPPPSLACPGSPDGLCPLSRLPLLTRRPLPSLACRCSPDGRPPPACARRVPGLFRTSDSYIVQSRSWLPDAVGGVLWWGAHAAPYTLYVPFAAGMQRLPACTLGTPAALDRSTLFWGVRYLYNYAQLKRDKMIGTINALQDSFHAKALQLQVEVDLMPANASSVRPPCSPVTKRSSPKERNVCCSIRLAALPSTTRERNDERCSLPLRHRPALSSGRRWPLLRPTASMRRTRRMRTWRCRRWARRPTASS